MRLIARSALVLIALLGTVGCDILDRKADATYWFWTRLQGIQWYGNREITGLNRANYDLIKASDIDGVMHNFTTLSQKHSHAAAKLKALDATDVDETVLDYRERLVQAHAVLSKEFAVHATATRRVDISELQQGQGRLRTSLTEYVELCNEADSIMSSLQKRYNRDFNYAERPN
jgi:hypothetical protein